MLASATAVAVVAMQAPRKLPTMTEIPDSDADGARRCACCNRKRAKALLKHHWFDALTTVLFVAFAIVITQVEGADDAANVWWVVAVAIGAWPASRIIEVALQHLFRTVVTPLMAWYLGVLWQRLPVWLWCSSMIVVLRRKPVDGDEYMESLCWLAIIITVVRAVVRLATRVLQHMVAQKASPQKKRALARALMLLADLYHRSQQSGSHTVNMAPSGLPVSHSCSSISSLASAGAASERGGDKPNAGALASSGDEKAVPVSPPPVPVSNTQAFEAMLARDKPSDRPAYTRSLSGGDRPNVGIDVPTSSATVNKTSGPARRLASIAKSLRPTRSAARQGRPRKPKIPPVANNQALFEEYIDLMDEDEPQIQTLSRLFYYIQKGVPSMVVNFRALRKLLCREDATVLASQLALFKTAFTKEEFVSAAAFVFKSWAKQSQPPSHKQNYTWVLTALVGSVIVAPVVLWYWPSWGVERCVQVDTLLAISAPFLFMLLLGVNPVTVLVPVGSSLLAASFMFAPSAQAFIQCLTFVLVQHPFDKDDVVRGIAVVDGLVCVPCRVHHVDFLATRCACNQVVIDKVPYRVDKVSLMTSAMVNYITNARTYMPNVVLATKTIVNAQRSQHAYANVRRRISCYALSALCRAGASLCAHVCLGAWKA